MFSRFLTVASILVFIASAAIALPKRVTLDHQRQAYAPEAAIGADFGGVILINDLTAATQNGENTALSQLQIASFDDEKGLCIVISSQDGMSDCYFLMISEDHLARMISFIDNEGFGIYTAFDNQRVIDNISKSAGMTRSEQFGGLVAIEFAGDAELESIAYGLDFRSVPPEKVSEARTNNILGTLNGSRKPGGRSLSYVVADFSTEFNASLTQDTIKVSGHLYHYNRSMDATGQYVYYTGVQIYPEKNIVLGEINQAAPEMLESARSELAFEKSISPEQISDEDLEAFITTSMRQEIAEVRGITQDEIPDSEILAIKELVYGNATERTLYALPEELNHIVAEYEGFDNQQWFAGSLALLRTIKTLQPENWTSFGDQFFDSE